MYYIMSFLILGANGYLGNWTKKILEEQGFKTTSSNVRLNNYNELERVIIDSNCKYVICAAGISGKPTIEWCETHSHETFQTNVLDTMNLVSTCYKLHKHITLYGSGLIYNGDKNIYSENDIPNYYDKIYTKYRILLEKMLISSPYDNWLYLRILFPCTMDNHQKCFYEKLKHKPYLHDISVPLTIVPYLFKFLSTLILNDIKGIFNFVNKDVLHLSILNPNADIKPPDQHTRGAYELDVTKLERSLNIQILNVKECIKLYLNF